jgi:monoamine oxidase
VIAQKEVFNSGDSVAVIGGGFAGLAAGFYLAGERARFSVFEARDGVGGRVRTESAFISNRLIEAGGELIGMNHPIWLTLALKFQLALSVVTPDIDFAGAGLHMPLQIRSGMKVSPAYQSNATIQSRRGIRFFYLRFFWAQPRMDERTRWPHEQLRNSRAYQIGGHDHGWSFDDRQAHI